MENRNDLPKQIENPSFGFEDVFGKDALVEKIEGKYVVKGKLKDGFVTGGQEYEIHMKPIKPEILVGIDGVMEVEKMIIEGSDKLARRFERIWFYNIPSEIREEKMSGAGYTGLAKEAMEDHYGTYNGEYEGKSLLLVSRFRNGDVIAAMYHEAGHEMVGKTIPDEDAKRRRLGWLRDIRIAMGMDMTDEEIELAEWYAQIEVQASTEAMKLINNDRLDGDIVFPGDEDLMRVKNFYTVFAISFTRKYPEIKDRLINLFQKELSKLDIKA